MVEYSKKENTNFCIAEFEEQIRIIGTPKVGMKEPKIGQNIRIENSSFEKGRFKFNMTLVQDKRS